MNWTFSIQKSDYNRFYQYGSPGSTYTGAHGAVSSNPSFTDYVNNNLSLQPSSPCIGTGDNTLGSTYNQGIAPGATWPNPDIGDPNRSLGCRGLCLRWRKHQPGGFGFARHN